MFGAHDHREICDCNVHVQKATYECNSLVHIAIATEQKTFGGGDGVAIESQLFSKGSTNCELPALFSRTSIDDVFFNFMSHVFFL